MNESQTCVIRFQWFWLARVLRATLSLPQFPIITWSNVASISANTCCLPAVSLPPRGSERVPHGGTRQSLDKPYAPSDNQKGILNPNSIRVRARALLLSLKFQ